MTMQIVPTIEEAGAKLSVSRWFNSTRDTISSGDALIEINTANLTNKILVPITGVLSTISVKDGGYVEVSTALGSIRQF